MEVNGHGGRDMVAVSGRRKLHEGCGIDVEETDVCVIEVGVI